MFATVVLSLVTVRHNDVFHTFAALFLNCKSGQNISKTWSCGQMDHYNRD